MHTENLVNVLNGMVDITTGELREHSPDYGSRVQLPVTFDPDMEFPRWYSFLTEIFPETDKMDDEFTLGENKAQLLQQFFGYCLMNTCKYEKCMFMYGTGSNGKSTVLNVLESIIGTEQTSAISIDDMGHRFNIPYLQNKMINIAAEVEGRDQRGTENFKKAISGDLISGEHKYGDKVQFRNRAKFIFAMNNPPNIGDKSYGFTRKVLILNFNRRFKKEERDLELFSTLMQEKAGIFTWALQGAGMLIENSGFVEGRGVQKDHAKFMNRLNSALTFLEEMCDIQDGLNVSCVALHKKYTAWCKEAIYRPLGRDKFYEHVLNFESVSKKRMEDKVTGSRPWVFTGIGLKI